MDGFIFIYIEEHGWAFYAHHSNYTIAVEMAKEIQKNWPCVLETKVLDHSDLIDKVFSTP